MSGKWKRRHDKLLVEVERLRLENDCLREDRDAAWTEANRLASWLETIPPDYGPYHSC